MSPARLPIRLFLAALSMILASCAWSTPPTEERSVETSRREIQDLPSGSLQALDIRFMARGYFHAKSAFRDPQALGGFWRSDNEPRRVQHDLPRGRVQLIARPDRRVAFDGRFEGLEVILANTTLETVGFAAQNSRLPIVREALDSSGQWRPIEYLPRSWCGNSYHQVFLPRNHFWSFDAPSYSGAQATRMRFVLEVEGLDEPVYSNEFAGSVNPEQFLIRQGHTPTGLMDPYVD